MNVQSWVRYFDSNQNTYDEPDWDSASSIPDGPERDQLVRSLRVFQLGETGEGRTLMRYASKLRGRAGFQDYDHALSQLIAEEGVHADLLAKTLRHLGSDTVQHQWSDAAFTFVRRLINLEFEIQVLVTGEIIGKAFYALMHARIDDELMRSVCGKLIRDEVQHVKFHADFLRARLDDLGPLRRSIWRAQFRMTFRLAALAVWTDHRRCFRAYDVTFREYWQKSTGMMYAFLRDASPKPAMAPSAI